MSDTFMLMIFSHPQSPQLPKLTLHAPFSQTDISTKGQKNFQIYRFQITNILIFVLAFASQKNWI